MCDPCGRDAKVQQRHDLEDLPSGDRVAFWQDVVCAHVYHVTSTDWIDPHSVSGAWEVRDCGGFGLADVKSSNRSRSRNACDIAHDHVDVVALQLVLHNPVAFEFLADSLALQPGDLCLFAMDWPHRVRSANGVSLRSLEVPRALLSPLIAGGSLCRPLALSGASALGALLASGLQAAWSQVPQLGVGVGEAVLRNLVGLAAVAHGASQEGLALARHGARAARFEEVTRYVTCHLANPDLSPERVAMALGMSVRYLHKLFESSDASFAQYVTQQRLQACRVSLADSSSLSRSVADTAFGWGFASLPTFYRSFAASFGMTPGEMRRMGASPAAR